MRHAPGNRTTADPVAAHISPVIFNDYDSILMPSLPYYRELTAVEKDLFVRRLNSLMDTRQFHFIGMEASRGPTVLVSAVTIQISFGLKKFMLPYFRDIFIMPDAYHLKGAGELYIGHVSPKGIYISWRHFQEGFAIPNDGVTVAYHELAHAIHHENFIEETGIDWDFREDFARLPHIFGPVLSASIKEHKSYLRGYAFTNFFEFWAVSVEAFFEDPQGMKDNLPKLHKILSEVLNQDPLRSPKVLSTSDEKP